MLYANHSVRLEATYLPFDAFFLAACTVASGLDLFVSLHKEKSKGVTSSFQVSTSRSKSWKKACTLAQLDFSHCLKLIYASITGACILHRSGGRYLYGSRRG